MLVCSCTKMHATPLITLIFYAHELTTLRADTIMIPPDNIHPSQIQMMCTTFQHKSCKLYAFLTLIVHALSSFVLLSLIFPVRCSLEQPSNSKKFQWCLHSNKRHIESIQMIRGHWSLNSTEIHSNSMHSVALFPLMATNYFEEVKTRCRSSLTSCLMWEIIPNGFVATVFKLI